MGGWDALPSRQAIKQAAATDARYWRMGRGSQVNTEEEKQRYIQTYFVINVKVPSQPFDDMSVSILMSIPFLI